MSEKYGAFQSTIGVTALVQSGDFSFSRSWQALPARIIIHLLHEKRPRFGGAEPTPPLAALGKHSANVHFARLQGKPLTLMPPAGGRLAAEPQKGGTLGAPERKTPSAYRVDG